MQPAQPAQPIQADIARDWVLSQNLDEISTDIVDGPGVGGSDYGDEGPQAGDDEAEVGGLQAGVGGDGQAQHEGSAPVSFVRGTVANMQYVGPPNTTQWPAENHLRNIYILAEGHHPHTLRVAPGGHEVTI